MLLAPMDLLATLQMLNMRYSHWLHCCRVCFNICGGVLIYSSAFLYWRVDVLNKKCYIQILHAWDASLLK